MSLNPVISVDASFNKVLGLDVSFNVNATTDNNETPLVYSIDNTNVAIIDQQTGEVTILQQGQAIITVSQLASASYNAGSTTSQLFVRTAPTITVDASFEIVYAVDASFNLDASSNNLETPLLYSSSNTNVATVDSSGNVHIVRAGETIITVSQEESETYLAASATSTIYVTTQPTVINVDASFNKVYGNGPFYLNATSNSPATINYSISSGDQIYATVNSSGQVTILGACPTFVLITIHQDAVESVITSTNEYSAATTTTELYITKQETVLTLDPSYNKTYGVDVSFNVGATSNNTESIINYSSSVPSVATIDINGNVYILEAGQTVITASQSASTNFTDDQTTSTLYVSKGNANLQMQSSTFSKTYGTDVSFNVGATTDNTEVDIFYSILDTTIATIDQSGNVSILKAGSTTITVQQAETDNYLQSESSSSLIVSRQTTVIGLDASYNKIFGDASFNVNATTNNTETPIVYSSSNTLVATIDSSTGQVTLGSYAGETVITASQPETTNYTLGSTSSTLYVSDQQTVINVDASFNKTYGDASFNLNVSSNSPATFQYSIAVEDQIYATVNSSGQVTIVGACPTFVLITISQAAYENIVTAQYEYSAASTTTKLYIAKKQTIIYNPPPATLTKTYIPDYFFNAADPYSNDPSLPLESTSSNPSVADNWGIYNDIISIFAAGITTMYWTHPENNNFTFAQVSMVLTVNRANPMLATNFTSPKIFGEPSFNVNATSNSPSTISYSSSNPSIASIDSTGEVTMHQSGSVTLTISQPQSSNYEAGELVQTLVVSESTPSNPVVCDTPEEFVLAITSGAPFITIQGDLVLDSNTYLTNYGSSYQVLTNSSNTVVKLIKELISFSYIVSKNNITDEGLPIGGTVEKDMNSEDYRDEFDPINYPNLFPGMEPLITSNIVVGDKNESDIYNASYWDDLGDDVFDEWGYFFIYDVVGKQYFFPILSPENEADGVIINQTFNAFGKTFTLNHGWPVEGIFKMEIMCNDDNFVFKFGCYGNMGSDGNEVLEDLTYTYSIGSETLNLYYHMDAQEGRPREILFTYVIPTRTDQNTSKTYNVIYDYDDMSLISVPVTKGLIVYFSKTNDVKEWVSQDLMIV